MERMHGSPLFELMDRVLPDTVDEAILEHLVQTTPVNSAGFDPFGLDLSTALRTLKAVVPLYRHWFRVRTHGIDRVPPGRVMLVPNHSGQLPMDALLIAIAMVLEGHPPRLVRGMVERWFPSVPFVSTLITRCGQVTGDPENCVELLRREQAILVFPEGIRGSGKLWWNRYNLQEFGTGFARIALETDSPIVPVAVVGAEETFPAVYNFESLARRLGMPYWPVTPFFPALGLLGVVPLPVQIDLYFGEPIHLDGDHDAPDTEIAADVERVKGAIDAMIEKGLARRPRLTRGRP